MQRHILIVANYRSECGDCITALWCDIQPCVINVFRNMPTAECHSLLEYYDWQNGIAVDSPRELLGELYRLSYPAPLRDRIRSNLPAMLDRQD